jgi:8-oxo-dGTP diphosphatase
VSPSRKGPIIAVGAVILDREGKILLVKRRNPPNAGKWAVPGGKVELGETLEEAVIRETLEETSLEVKPTILLSVVEVVGPVYHYVILDYQCDVIGGELEPGSDALEANYFEISDALRTDVPDSMRLLLEELAKGAERLPIHIAAKLTSLT